jgi:hypothetical protein
MNSKMNNKMNKMKILLINKTLINKMLMNMNKQMNQITWIRKMKKLMKIIYKNNENNYCMNDLFYLFIYFELFVYYIDILIYLLFFY